jgi:hypothetical protein
MQRCQKDVGAAKSAKEKEKLRRVRGSIDVGH